MSCFVVPLTEAVLTSLTTVVIEHTYKKDSEKAILRDTIVKEGKLLSKMLWLVTGALIIDHILNGELMASYPFFTAATSPEGVATMIEEISTVGVAIAAFTTLVWGILVFSHVMHSISKKQRETV
ncbi:MAG: hypothetical protein K6A31_06195 [Fibrobacter sp.]|nr:hypothetical protein [Fibrobacter sp.]